jgi:dienelactone hydrolase
MMRRREFITLLGGAALAARAASSAVVLAATVACLVAIARGEPRATLADGVIGRIEFQSYTPVSQTPFLNRSYLKDPPVVLSGELTLPKQSLLQKNGKSPAVILMHGVGGISENRERAWARRLNSWGIAAFVVDSFAGREIKPPIYAGNPKFTHVVAHLLDAYLALRLLATHPKIDGSRVAVMGFSRGGETAVNAVFEPFRVAALADDPLRFAAYIPLYPYCNFRHVSKSLATGPMLMLLGGADEMDEPAACEHLATWLKDHSVPVHVLVYPGAHHAFDGQRRVQFDRNFVGIRGCEAEYDLDTHATRRLDTGATLASKQAMDDWLRQCRHQGARFGGDPKALEAAIADVRGFLREAFAR